MSAFVCDRDHIAYLASFCRIDWDFSYYWNKEWHFVNTSEDALLLGQKLWDENITSVLYRYSDRTREDIPGPIGEDFVLNLEDLFCDNFNPVQVLKACICLEYQSCEHAEYEGSEAYAILKTIQARAIRCLPGYKEAKWGAPKRHSKAVLFILNGSNSHE